ncbi:MAG: (Na+)-NQR maturation NqrM [Pseudomonadota bacterium]
MATFLLTFGFLMLIVLGMAAGVLLMGRSIKGSCGGLNAITDADQCLVCNKDIDPNSPLRERLLCPRARKMLERADLAEQAAPRG